MTWLEPTKFLARVVTGHGPFEAYYERFRLRPPRASRFGLPEQTADHVPWHCSLTEEPRTRTLERMNEANGADAASTGDWSNSDWFATRATYRILVSLARDVVGCCKRLDDVEGQ